MSDRKFIEKTPFTDPHKAADIVIDMIQRAGAPGHVWYHTPTDRVRVCGADYSGEDGEVLLGVYTRTVTRARIAMDIKAARTAPQTVKRTRSVTVSETVETTEAAADIPKFIPCGPNADAAVIPASEPIQEVSEICMPIAIQNPAPLPALPARAKDDAYGAAVWALVGARDKIDARIGELQLLRALFDRKMSDRLAALLEDYAELLENGLGFDGDDAKLLADRAADAKEWARRFALHANLGDDSIFLRAAKQLRAWEKTCEDCAHNDTSDIGNECRVDAAECDEIASIFEFAAIKPPDTE